MDSIVVFYVSKFTYRFSLEDKTIHLNSDYMDYSKVRVEALC